MANYNKFVKLFLSSVKDDPINLELPNTYKLALFNSSYTPEEDEIYSFKDLQLTGEYEIVDKNGSYTPGGKYIKFIDVDKNELGIRDTFTSNWRYNISEAVWTNVNADDIAYAVTYRESDGLMISCYALEPAKSAVNEDVRIKWLSLAIGIENNPLEVDYNLNAKSTNPLENRVITEMFKKLGVIFKDYDTEYPDVYPDDDSYEDFKAKINEMTPFGGEAIDDIFRRYIEGN